MRCVVELTKIKRKKNTQDHKTPNPLDLPQFGNRSLGEAIPQCPNAPMHSTQK